jgi:metal-responsive CopG/Arc/MetJ family transcriptional regulator
MQVLVHLPDDLANRFKSTVHKRLRSAFIADLLNKAIPEQEDALFRLAMEVENDTGVSELESEWKVTVGDGLETR